MSFLYNFPIKQYWRLWMWKTQLRDGARASAKRLWACSWFSGSFRSSLWQSIHIWSTLTCCENETILPSKAQSQRFKKHEPIWEKQRMTSWQRFLVSQYLKTISISSRSGAICALPFQETTHIRMLFSSIKTASSQVLRASRIRPIWGRKIGIKARFKKRGRFTGRRRITLKQQVNGWRPHRPSSETRKAIQA